MLSKSFQFYFSHHFFIFFRTQHTIHRIQFCISCLSYSWERCLLYCEKIVNLLLQRVVVCFYKISDICTGLILSRGKDWVFSWTRKKSGVLVWSWAVERIEFALTLVKGVVYRFGSGSDLRKESESFIQIPKRHLGSGVGRVWPKHYKIKVLYFLTLFLFKFLFLFLFKF